MTASIDISESRLNLFISNDLYTVTGTGLTDWAGGNDGGFFEFGGNASLKPNFGNTGSSEYSAPLISEAEAKSTLRIYNNTFVAAVPEPSSTALLGLGGLALILRRRK